MTILAEQHRAAAVFKLRVARQGEQHFRDPDIRQEGVI